MTVRVGDLVVILAPHPEAGAVGTVERVIRADRYSGRRARVRFGEPYPGGQIVAISMLRILPR